jgi:hypothetical protein
MGTRKRKRTNAVVGTQQHSQSSPATQQHTSAPYEDVGPSSNSNEQSPSNNDNVIMTDSAALMDAVEKRRMPQSSWSLQSGPFSGCIAQHDESPSNMNPTPIDDSMQQNKGDFPPDMREPMLSTYITFERMNDLIKDHQHHSSLMDEDSVVHVKVLGSLNVRCSADDMRSPFEESEMGRNLSSLSTHS